MGGTWAKRVFVLLIMRIGVGIPKIVRGPINPNLIVTTKVIFCAVFRLSFVWLFRPTGVENMDKPITKGPLSHREHPAGIKGTG